MIDEAEETGDPDKVSDSVPEAEPSSPVKSSERYFIVKSLTLQDLEQSVRSGVWATQSHNENTLNEAYEVILLCATHHAILLLTLITGCRQRLPHLLGQQVRRVLWLRKNGIPHFGKRRRNLWHYS